ncbi:MAG: type I citrate synthase [Ignavibacteriae bacterium HGW-Ignavibacteriae-3]|nr:MAG: type I citrate synthase [Ignavibacteriae bacterium HGW-Ignavibacteriae-3]
MSVLKEKLRAKIIAERPRTEKLLKEYGNVKVDEVTIGQIIGGMRDIKSLVTDISYLDPFEGIRFRGFTIPEVLEKLPKVAGKDMPSVEAFFYLLLTGDVPTAAEVDAVHEEFNKRKEVPKYVFDVLRAMPKDSHPMTMFATGILSMQKDSVFVEEYHKGIKKGEYWEAYYEDSLNLLAKLPELGAFIYRLKYRNGDIIGGDGKLDFGGNFARMMGIDKPYDDIARLYFILHSDHESGNVSAHTGHLVASALSDIYYAIGAMLTGLAGPLHGLANEEVLRWLQGVMDEMGGKIPTEDEMKKFVMDTLDSGKVIPGFGHAVLRKTDPRYTAQREFCLQHLPEDPIFKYVDLLYKVVPDILIAKGKAKNPWPNVDAQSGVIQWHYGVKEYEFYTVLFGIGRALGVCSNIIWARALGYPLERPKSLTTDMLEEVAFGNK